MLGLTALVMIIAGIGVIALTGLAVQRAALNGVVEQEVPTLRLALQLAQRSQVVVSNAQRLIASDSHFVRRRFAQWIDDQSKDLSSLVARIPAGVADTAEIERIRQLRSELGERLLALDLAVGARLEATDRVGSLIQTLERSRIALQTIRDANNPAGEHGPAGERWAGERWLNDADRLLLTAAGILLTESPRISSASQELLLAAGRSVLTVPSGLQRGDPAALQRLLRDMAAISNAESGVVVAVSRQQEAVRAVEAQASLTSQVSNRFLAAIELLVRSVEEHASAAGVSAEADTDRRQWLVGILLVSGLVAAVLILLYVRHGVVRRLSAVAKSMRDHVSGRTAAIPTAGHDEIADIGRALAFLVATITEREAALLTSRERAEATADYLRTALSRIVQSEKMAALGRLVAGVAHEVNTPVGVALSGVTGMQRELERLRGRFESGQLSRSDLMETLDLLDEGGEIVTHNIRRAADLVRSFKLVAPENELGPPRRFDLSENLRGLMAMLAPIAGQAGHSLHLNCPEGLVAVGFPDVMDRILEQLVSNALVHAFVAGASGRVSVEVKEDGEDWLQITVTDNGRGIAPDQLARIFDPFFTTRRAGGHAGLGLHVVYNLVAARLQGEVSASSAENEGARFILRLPRRLESATASGSDISDADGSSGRAAVTVETAPALLPAPLPSS